MDFGRCNVISSKREKASGNIKVHIHRLLHKWGFNPRFHRKGSSEEPLRRRRKVLKKGTKGPGGLKKDGNVMVEDESIFMHDSVAKEKETDLKGRKTM